MVEATLTNDMEIVHNQCDTFFEKMGKDPARHLKTTTTEVRGYLWDSPPVNSDTAGKGVVGMLSWHGSHFWVCITICRVRHGDSVTKPDYYYYYYYYYYYLLPLGPISPATHTDRMMLIMWIVPVSLKD